MAPLRLMVGPRWRYVWAAMNVLPVPGAGAIVVGARNPHSRLLPHGVGQALLVLFGSWPLVVPGLAGLAWAVWDAVRIAQCEMIPRPPAE